MIGLTICIIGLFILFQLTKTPTIEGITMPYDAKTAKTISDTATAAAATIQSSNNLALTSLNAAKIVDGDILNMLTLANTSSTTMTSTNSANVTATTDISALVTASASAATSAINIKTSIDPSSITTDSDSFNELTTAISDSVTLSSNASTSASKAATAINTASVSINLAITACALAATNSANAATLTTVALTDATAAATASTAALNSINKISFVSMQTYKTLLDPSSNPVASTNL